jgi:hypothetical protein
MLTCDHHNAKLIDPMSIDARTAFVNRACALTSRGPCPLDQRSRLFIGLGEWPLVREIDLVDFDAAGTVGSYPIPEIDSLSHPDSGLGLTLSFASDGRDTIAADLKTSRISGFGTGPSP